MPALDLLAAINDKPVALRFFEDNQAMIRVCESGRNPTMRHLGRTHGVSVEWLSERIQSPEIQLTYCQTLDMVADIYTKAFADPMKWKHACHLAGIVAPKELNEVICCRIKRMLEVSGNQIAADPADMHPPAAPAPSSRGEGPSSVFDGLDGNRCVPGFKAEIDPKVQVDMLCLVNQITWPVQKCATTTGKDRCLGATYEADLGARVGQLNQKRRDFMMITSRRHG